MEQKNGEECVILGATKISILQFQFNSFTFLKGDICDIGDICNMMEGQGEVFFKCKMCYFTKSVTSAAVDTKQAAEGINLAGA